MIPRELVKKSIDMIRGSALTVPATIVFSLLLHEGEDLSQIWRGIDD